MMVRTDVCATSAWLAVRRPAGLLSRADASGRTVLVVAALSFFAFTNGTRAEEIRWLPFAEMRGALRNSVGLTWSGQTLREGLRSLTESQRVACWLDRRIDPDQRIDLSTDSAALDTIFREIARRIDADVGFVGPVVYLGPKSTAKGLWTICEIRTAEIARLPTDVRTKWMQRRPANWETLSTPKELLQETAEGLGCTLAGVDAIPHDLWPAGRFPPLNGVERLTLLLAPFELTFSVTADGSVIRFEPLPRTPELERQYTLARSPAVTLESLAAAVPNAVISRSGSRITAQGTAEDHDAIARILRGEKSATAVPATPAETRYTLKIQNVPAGDVLLTLETRAGLKMEIDPALKEKLKTRVSIDVKDARLEQLIEATLKETGLTFDLVGSQLKIIPR